MNWAWATSLDDLWRSPALPLWLILAAAGFFGIVVLITLLRAEKSMANGALAVIALAAIGIAVAVTLRGFGPSGGGAPVETRFPRPMTAALPALACIDDMAGEAVLTACEKVLFGSPESAAAALSYAASMVTRLTASGDAATANASATSELQMLRRAVERDRYGLMAYVLAVRDHCTPATCPVFRSLTDSSQIAANLDDRVYDGLVARYAPSWNAPAAPAPVATLSPGATGKPTNADFPSAASTPPVSIMNPEPGTGSASTSSAPRAPASTANANAPSPRPASAPAAAAAKKPPAPKPPRSLAPPPAPTPPPVPAPPAAND